MAFRKGSTDVAAKAAVILDDIESALTEAGWTDLGQFDTGGFEYHGWRASAALSGGIEWVVVFEVADSGEGDLRIFAGENWRSSDGKIQKPAVGAGPELMLSSTSNRPVSECRWWLMRDGGDHSIAAPIGEYDMGNPWWWDTWGGSPVTSTIVHCTDPVLVQWLISVKGSFFHLTTFRWNANAHRHGGAVMIKSFLPWAPTGHLIGVFQALDNNNLCGLNVNRPSMHPEFERYIHPGYSDDLDSSAWTRQQSFRAWYMVSLEAGYQSTTPSGVSHSLYNHRGTIFGGGIPAFPCFLRSNNFDAYTVNPDDINDTTSGLSNMTGRGMIGTLPGIRGIKGVTTTLNFGDEVEDFNLNRYMYALPSWSTSQNQMWVEK